MLFYRGHKITAFLFLKISTGRRTYMELKLTDRLYLAAKPIWDGYHDHPFILELGEGTLPIPKFRYYMLQDYVYLFDYAKVFALGLVKAKDEELMRLFSDYVYSTLNGEMGIHKSYMKRLGITDDEVRAVRMALPNISYTHYMLTIGYNEDVLAILVSILACAWSYQLIGEKLSEIPGASEHEFYGEWIKGYSSEDYAAGNDRLIETIDKLGENISEDDAAHLIEIFINCSMYEEGFWDMAYNMV